MPNSAMYKKGTYRIVENRPLTSNVYRMQVEGDTQWIVRPGQFVNIEIEGFYLRRPISICDYSDNTITLIYKVVGRGTEAMSHMQAGRGLDMLTGLGNGLGPAVECRPPPPAGGGAGVPAPPRPASGTTPGWKPDCRKKTCATSSPRPRSSRPSAA